MKLFAFLKQDKNKNTAKQTVNRELGYYHIDPEEWVVPTTLTPSAVQAVLDSNDNLQIQNMVDTFLKIDPDFLGKYGDRLSISRKVKISWRPASDDKKDIDICNEVKEMLEPIITKKIIKHHLKAAFRKFAVSEIVWDIKNGKLAPIAIYPLPVRSFDLSTASDTEEHRLNMMLMLFNADKEEYSDIPLFKTIQTFSPYELDHSIISLGEALAKIIIIKYYCMNKQWPKFNELFAVPPVLVRAEENISEENLAVLREAVANIGSNLKAVLKGAGEISFPQPADGKPEKFTALLDACKNAIYLAIIGQPATSGTGKESAYASMKVLYGVREDIVTDDLDMVAEALNEQLIKPVVMFNYGEDVLFPTLELLIPSKISDLADNDKKLKDLGIKFTKKYFMSRYDLNEDDFEIDDSGDIIPLSAKADDIKIRMLKEWEQAADTLHPDSQHRLDPYM